MGKLLQRLQEAAKSGVYRTSRMAPITEALRGAAADLACVSLHGVSKKAGLMSAFAGGLRLPAGFGANWDALEDCLSDLSWRQGDGHVIAIEGVESLPQEDAGVLVDVLAAAAEFWRGRGKPFFAVFVDPARGLALPDLFDEA